MFVTFQILMFDSLRRRTCLHYAAYYGHVDCLKAILSAAHSTPVADSWFDSLLSLSLSLFHMPQLWMQAQIDMNGTNSKLFIGVLSGDLLDL